MNLVKIFIVTGLIFVAFVSKANPVYKRTNNFNNYKDPFNEFGYGINAVYLKNEKEVAPLLNLYYSRNLTHYFSLGASYCSIYSYDFHNAFSAKISFRIFNNLVLSLKPGIYIKSNIGKKQFLYYFGFESAYQFKLSDKIGVGPMFDYELIQDDVYLIGGFQMSFYF